MKTLDLFLILLVGTSAYASSYDSYFDVGVGYKNAHFERDAELLIFSDGSVRDLNITFKDLSLVTFDANFKCFLTKCLYVRCDGQYGWLTHGHTERSTAAFTLQADLNGTYSNEGHIANINGGLGFQLFSQCDFDMSPTIGIGYNNLAVSAQEGEETIFSNSLTWIGPWFGFDLGYSPSPALSFELDYAFHLVRYRDYHVDIPFNLASLDLKYDNSIGNTLLLNGTYLFCNGWRLGLDLTYEHWESHGQPETRAVILAPLPSTLASETDTFWSYGIRCKIGRFF